MGNHEKSTFDAVLPALISLLFCTLLTGSPANKAFAADAPAAAQVSQESPATEPEYHTPLAGEPTIQEAFGRTVNIERRTRDNAAALVLAATACTPPLAEDRLLPFGAIYLKHRWDETRFRGIFSFLVNEVDLSETYGK